MDRYNERRLHIANSKKSNKSKLEAADVKFQQARMSYEALAAELKNDLPILERDVKEFVGPVFANFVRFQADFLQSILFLFNGVVPQVYISFPFPSSFSFTSFSFSSFTNLFIILFCPLHYNCYQEH